MLRLNLQKLGLTESAPTESGGGGGGYLDSVESSTCCDLDASVSESYTSGQTFSNLVASPAGGADQTDWDFWLGADETASAQDPTFSTNKFTSDGGDAMSIKNKTTATGRPAVIDRMLDTSSGTGFWVFFTLELGSTLANNDYFFGAGASNAGDVFFWLGTESDGDLRIAYQTDTDGFSLHVAAPSVFSTNSTNIVGVSFDPTSSTNNVRAWVNTATANVTSLAVSANTEDVARGFVLLTRCAVDQNSYTQSMPNGTALRSFAFGNTFIDDSAAAAIISHLEARHSVDYTP